MTTPSRFQACVGPSMNKVHIRDTQNPSRLVMCCSTVATRNYKGALAADEQLCAKCFKALEEKLTAGSTYKIVLTAEMIGVRELI